MSPIDHPAEEDLVMLYYREDALVENGGAGRLHAHLAVCESCQSAYRNLVRVLDACNDIPVPEPHHAFESRMWNRLEPRLHPLGRWTLREVLRVNPLLTRGILAGAIAAMLIAAFIAGRISRPPSAAPRVVAITADGRHRVLVTALSDHLERSQMILVELANDTDAELALDRERVRSLINENRLFRQTSTPATDPAMARVLDDLERVLLDISHGADPAVIKSRIESEGLLFKLRVLGSNLNQGAVESNKPQSALPRSGDVTARTSKFQERI